MRPTVTQESVGRLPRLALLLLCVLYGVPGFFAHDPWRDAEATALSQMLGMSEATLGWDFTPYLGRASIALFSPMLDPALAARIPFLLLLWACFAMLWYACYHFARHDNAQPVALPFGGEAHAIDYARAVADGSLLAFMACLGLAEKGHQAAPFLGQLFGVCVLLYGLAAFANEARKAVAAIALSALLICGFGAAGFAALLYIAMIAVALIRIHKPSPLFFYTLLISLAISLILLTVQGFFGAASSLSWRSINADWLSLFVWFLWPLWFIVGYGYFKLRLHRFRSSREIIDGESAAIPLRAAWHYAAPLTVALLALLRSLLVADADNALFLALPALAIAAALMLALMPRNVLAAIDWFALALFTGAAIFVWVLWIAAQTGMPAPINNNIERFYPGFRQANAWPFQALPFLVAALATMVWLALMVWRTSRARKPLWKGMVLTAGGVTLGWLLLQTLGAPMLNASRSYQSIVAKIDASVPANACVKAVGMNDTLRFLLSYRSQTHYESTAGKASVECVFMLVRHTRAQSPQADMSLDGWTRQWSLRRPTERDETFTLFQRTSTP